MPYRSKILLILIPFFCVGTVFSQEEKKKKNHWSQKLERKSYLTPYIGLAIFSGAEKLNRFGQSSNLYSNLAPGPSVGIGMWFKFNANLHFGADLGFITTSKPNYDISSGNLNIGAKFFPFKTEKKINPYLTGGLQFNMIYVGQDAHKKSYIPDTSQSLQDFGVVVQYETRYQNIDVLAGPLMGPYIGGGASYAINKKYKIFLQANFQPTLNENNVISNNFEFNEGLFQYTMIKGGVSIQLFKPKPPEIDTNQVPVPDQILALEVPESISERGMLIREGIFDIIIREGLKHVVRVNTTGPEIIIEETIKDPCKAICYLVDENGGILAKAESTPEGKIVFTDVQKGIYDVIFVLEKPCIEANFTYKFPDPHTQPIMEFNTEGVMIDSLTYQITGSVLLPDSADYSFVYKKSAIFISDSDNPAANKNLDIRVYLANSDKRIIRYYDPQKNEQFSFKKLPDTGYEVIYKVPDAEQKSGITYTVADNHKYIIKRATFENFSDSSATNANDKLFDNMKYLLKGKITLFDSITTYNEVVLYLVNHKKRIVSMRNPEKDGTFVFKNLKSKNIYSVYYELQYSKGRAKIEYHYEEPVFVQRSVYGQSYVPPAKPTIPDFPVYETGVTYSPLGKTVNPQGYGVHVGAFENVINVETTCRKLRDEGFKDISIQVFMTDWLNKRFGFSRNFKIHRIVVGQYSHEKEAIKTKGLLEYLGYDSYVVRHFEKK